MKLAIQALIREFQEWEIPCSFPRKIHFVIFPENIRKVHVLMGARHGGKTWIFYQKMLELLHNGLEKRKILYINFEDDRLANFASSDF